MRMQILKAAIEAPHLDWPVLIPARQGLWTVYRDWRVQVTLDKIDIDVVIHKGFVSDLDSVPRIPVFYEIFKGRTRVGALVHDWLYQKKHKRKDADMIFLALMCVEGVKKRYSLPIYFAVRLFGWIWYERKPRVGKVEN